LALLEALGFDNLLQPDIINNVLGLIELPGRLQTVQTERDWLLDVAHNAASAEVLADSLTEMRSGRRITAIIGLLEDKKAADIIVPLCRVVDSWIAVRAESPRARSAAELAAIVAQCCGKPCLVADDIGAALHEAKMRTPDSEIILVCGSFYVVGPALDELYSRPRNGSTAILSPPTNG
jgi:dihydrofolate synthase/folylpolyglutamate synthase